MRTNLAEQLGVPKDMILHLIEKMDVPFNGKPEWFYAGDEEYLKMVRQAYQDSFDSVTGTIARRMKLEADGTDISRYATIRFKAIKEDIRETIQDLDRELGKIMTKGYKNTEQQVAAMAQASGPGVGEAFDKFISASTKPYLYKGAYLHDFTDSMLKNYNKELLLKVESQLRMGVIQRKSWGAIVTDLRQKAFGLEPYQRAKGITYKAQRLVRTELARRRQLAINEFIKSPSIVGVTILFGGGPCLSGICYEKVGEYYKGENWPPPETPFHPNCRCSVVRLHAKLDTLQGAE